MLSSAELLEKIREIHREIHPEFQGYPDTIQDNLESGKRIQGITSQYQLLKDYLENETSAKHRVLYLQYQLELLRRARSNIMDDFSETEQLDVQRLEWLRKLGFWFAMPLAMSLNACGEFLFANETVSIIPDTSKALRLTLSVILTAVSASLFYSFEVHLLKTALGLKHVHSQMALELEIRANIVTAVSDLQAAFFSTKKALISPEDHGAMEAFLTAREKEIADLKSKYQPERESRLGDVIKVGVTTIGALMALASGYFYAKSLMMLLVPFLIGTPYGWAIIGVIMGIALCLYGAMRASGMMNRSNPVCLQSKNFANKLQSFNISTEEQYKNAITSHKAILGAKQGEQQVKGNERNSWIYPNLYDNYSGTRPASNDPLPPVQSEKFAP